MDSYDRAKDNKTQSNTTNSPYIFENLKSKYILQKIFGNLKENKFLKIIKHSKEFQIRLDVNINNYKKYTEIEIEIIPKINESGVFINIPNKEDELYFHIFFNDNKDEIKRTYFNNNENISKIKIIIDYPAKSLYRLFKNCECIERINFKKFNISNINTHNSR